MTMPRMEAPKQVWQYFHIKLGLHPSDDFRGVCHLRPDLVPGQPVGMDDVAVAVAYNGFVGRTCFMHTVIPRPECVTRAIVREAFNYPFVVCGCEAIVALVDSNNDAALRFDTRLGFKEVARIANAGPEADLVIMRMLRSECRWLRPH